jgi:hypothetical protein
MISRYPAAGAWHADQACYLCHRVEDVIDTGRQIEGEGVLAICTACVRDMATEGGMDPEAEGEVEQMAEITGALTAERDRAVELAHKLRKQLRAEREKFAAVLAGDSEDDDEPEAGEIRYGPNTSPILDSEVLIPDFGKRDQ